MLFLQNAATGQTGFQLDPLTIIMLVVLAAMIFFMFRSNKKRKAQAEELQTKMVPGAEVMTNFGLFGELREIDEERNEALLEIAPGMIVRVHRQTLARVVEDDAVVAEERVDDAGDADEPRDRA
jgi:preprotein translocase subunit YajC